MGDFRIWWFLLVSISIPKRVIAKNQIHPNQSGCFGRDAPCRQFDYVIVGRFLRVGFSG